MRHVIEDIATDCANIARSRFIHEVEHLDVNERQEVFYEVKSMVFEKLMDMRNMIISACQNSKTEEAIERRKEV